MDRFTRFTHSKQLRSRFRPWLVFHNRRIIINQNEKEHSSLNWELEEFKWVSRRKHSEASARFIFFCRHLKTRLDSPNPIHDQSAADSYEGSRITMAWLGLATLYIESKAYNQNTHQPLTFTCGVRPSFCVPFNQTRNEMCKSKNWSIDLSSLNGLIRRVEEWVTPFREMDRLSSFSSSSKHMINELRWLKKTCVYSI